MPFEKSVLVPLNADETFALITQPDRLRRWQVVTARVDLRAGGAYRWTVIPGNSAAGTFTEADYHKATVCTEFDVTQLADHLIGSVTYLCAAAGAEPGAGPVTSPLETRVATAAQVTLEA